MPKPRVTDSRFDFRGGLNLSINPDLLADNELVDATNARLQTSYGAISKRTGTQRMHTTAIGSGNPVKGIVQWDSPSGKQIVAIAGGDLYHKTTELGEFTNAGGDFLTTTPALFATFRDKTSSASLVLYIAQGSRMFTWDGSTLTRIDGVDDAPLPFVIASYHTRIFTDHFSFRKFLFWSEVGVGESYTPGGITEGGAAMVDTLSGDVITALETVGSSLLIATRNTIVRFTGHSSDDIVIAQDTEGVSSEVGVVNALAIAKAEEIAAFISDRGPYLGSESGVQPIGVKVEPAFDEFDLDNAVVEYHRGRRELWFANEDEVYVYSLRLQSWYGPFTYSFTITSLARYEDSSGSEWLVAGCADGRVRHLDTGTLDDVLADDTGGSAYTMRVELPPIFFDSGPGVIKALDSLALQVNAPENSALVIQHSFDGEVATETAVLETSGTEHQRIDLSGQGYRLQLVFEDDGTDISHIFGYILTGWDYGRE